MTSIMLEKIKTKFGTFRNFMDCTSIRITKKIDYSKIDENIVKLIMHLNEKGLYTSDCCEGHKGKHGIIAFDTTIKWEDVISTAINKEKAKKYIVNKSCTDVITETDFQRVIIKCYLKDMYEIFGLAL